jgi:hypothetical protein
MDEIFYFKSSRLLRAKYYFPFTVASRFLSIVHPVTILVFRLVEQTWNLRLQPFRVDVLLQRVVDF